MKTKSELIEELNNKFYHYAFFPEKKSKEIEKKIVKFYFEEDLHINIIDRGRLSINSPFTDTIPLLLLFNKDNDIVAMATLTEILKFGLKFYSFGVYVGKKYRMKRVIKTSTLFNYLWPLVYYESYEYLQLSGNKNNILGLSGSADNDKIFEKHMERRTYVHDDYRHGYYIGDKSYVLFYPDTFIPEDA